MPFSPIDGFNHHKKIFKKHILPFLKHLELKESVFWAGGSLTGKINDIDLFLPTNKQWPVEKITEEKFQTPNCITTHFKDMKFQLCKYYKSTLLDLVESFDFAHIQVGIEIDNQQLKQFYCTDNYILSNLSKTSWFVGSEFPLSSLIRTLKYKCQGIFADREDIKAIIDTLAAVLNRGFNGYDDFKNQLDAVDLGLLPEDMKDISLPALSEIFAKLNKI